MYVLPPPSPPPRPQLKGAPDQPTTPSRRGPSARRHHTNARAKALAQTEALGAFARRASHPPHTTKSVTLKAVRCVTGSAAHGNTNMYSRLIQEQGGEERNGLRDVRGRRK